MQERDFFVDIHCHPTLRAFNAPIQSGNRNIWEPTSNPHIETPLGRWTRMKTREIAKTSQANFYSYAKGQVRVIFDSLYPIEKGFLNFRKAATAMMGKSKADEVLQTATGINRHQLRQLRNQNDYFHELQSQYAFLHQGQGASPDEQRRYQLVSNYDELLALKAKDPDCLAVVVTIEGAHAFNCGLPKEKGGPKANKAELTRNIGIAKSWEYPPFFVNLAHHFYNELCGHTRSFKGVVSAAFNQKRGINKGMTNLGWHVVHELLARDNGERVLIDIKHMSVKARMEYYQFLESYNRLNPSDPIPVICSHTGINDFSTMKASRSKPDKTKKMKHSDFSNWGINLSDEEIRIIHRSGGLIGIILDKTVLASQLLLERIRKIEDPNAVRKAFIEMVARNIFHVVGAVNEKSAWDILALGSDYDGCITYIDIYPDGTRLPDLKDDLIEFIKAENYKRELWFGLEPEEMIHKMMCNNSMDFMKNHFNRSAVATPQPEPATV